MQENFDFEPISASFPVFPVKAAVTYRLCDVFGADIPARVEIRYRACNAHDTVIGARGKPQTVERAPKQSGSLRVQSAELTLLCRGHLGVAAHSGAAEALLLDSPGGVCARPDIGGAFGALAAGELFKIHRKHINVQIHPVQQRT